MDGPIVRLAAGTRLVLVPDPELLPLALDMIRVHVDEPRVLSGAAAYLVADDRREARLFAMAVEAAQIYPDVDLTRESPLRLPVADTIEHDARIRIAKARASRLFPAMRATFRRARERVEAHGRLIAHGSELGDGAVATWQNESFDTLTGWGPLDAFRTDPEYPGEVTCRIAPDDEGPPQWLRLPGDERLLLDHGLSDRDREVAETVRSARAHLLGVVEHADEMGLDP